MRGDVLSLLDKYSLGLSDFFEKFKKGKVISRIQYQRELLASLIEHYIRCLDFFKNLNEYPQGPEKVFVFLPSNVPVVPFQLLPLLLVSGVKEVFFKYPRRENLFYDSLFYVLNTHLKENLKVEGAYLQHTEALERAKNYHFVIGFGGENLRLAFEAIKVPGRFFGPKFSVGILKEGYTSEMLGGIAWDNLAFDTKGCLSLSVLFTFDRDIREGLYHAFEKVSEILTPESDFRFDETEYEVYRNFQYFNAVRRGKDYFLVFSENFVPFSAPRVLQVIEVSSMDEIEDFIKKYNPYLQGIATNTQFLPKNNASMITSFGELQFTPCSWFFEKGVDYKNFWEV